MPNAFDQVSRSLLPKNVADLQQKVFDIAREEIEPLAKMVDAEKKWPQHSFAALAKAELMGLNAPKEVGGHGQGLLALAALTEAIGESCSSSAICFGMHCVGTAVIAAKTSDFHKRTFLEPIAEGRHITTLSLSESGTGSQFYISETDTQKQGDEVVINGLKQFVTNGGQADSYVLSTKASEQAGSGIFNLFVVEGNRQGIRWPVGWDGLGMRGNSSRGMKLENVHVPFANLLGDEGDEHWFVFEVVTPFFLVAMAGTYLGIAQAAFDLALNHIRTRTYSHSGEHLVDNPVLQSELAEMWIDIQRFREMLYAACKGGDEGQEEALPYLLAAKVQAAETCVRVCNQAMTLCGGAAYRENGKLSRLLRDSRAADVMSPTTHMLKQWTGRALLGLPLL
ncbi:MAG: acyl-CoA dehydrogenase family protein [Terriglobales bacterium]